MLTGGQPGHKRAGPLVGAADCGTRQLQGERRGRPRARKGGDTIPAGRGKGADSVVRESSPAFIAVRVCVCHAVLEEPNPLANVKGGNQPVKNLYGGLRI